MKLISDIIYLAGISTSASRLINLNISSNSLILSASIIALTWYNHRYIFLCMILANHDPNKIICKVLNTHKDSRIWNWIFTHRIDPANLVLAMPFPSLPLATWLAEVELCLFSATGAPWQVLLLCSNAHLEHLKLIDLLCWDEGAPLLGAPTYQCVANKSFN